ncbi:MAG TPA: hypothetical protein VHH55_03495, partial [Gaiellaceae bacterium]|nr:hypothetical protein [Gaiellaceae bacterium]
MNDANAITAASEAAPRSGGNLPVDVDGDHPPALAHEPGEQGGVVPRPGSDLEDAHAPLELELLEHERHDRRLRRGAQRNPVHAGLGDDRLVPVDGREPFPRGEVGHEELTRD